MTKCPKFCRQIARPIFVTGIPSRVRITYPHFWYIKGCGMCYHICGMMHIKEPLLLVGKLKFVLFNDATGTH